jgi:hypothetical protein
MRHWLVLMAHLIVTIIRIMAPGGARTVVAESLLLVQKHCLSVPWTASRWVWVRYSYVSYVPWIWITFYSGEDLGDTLKFEETSGLWKVLNFQIGG